MLGAVRRRFNDRLQLLMDQKSRQALLSSRPRLGYIGALGDSNLGDEVMFTAAKQLYPDYELVTLLSDWREDDLATKGLSGPDFFSGVILGGGTLVGPYWLPKIAHAQRQKCTIWTLGTGVGSSGFSDELSVPLDGWLDVLASMKQVGLRGPRSVAALANIGFTRAEPVGDLAAALTLAVPQELQAPHKIIINIAADPADSREAVDIPCLLALSNYLRLAHQFGTEIVPVIMHHSDAGPTHRFLDAARLHHAKVNMPEDFSAFARCVNGAAFMVSVRLHGTILAACCGVPSVSLGYRDKNLDFMESVGLGAFHVALETATLDATTEALKQMESQCVTLRGDLHDSMLGLKSRLIRYVQGGK